MSFIQQGVLKTGSLAVQIENSSGTIINPSTDGATAIGDGTTTVTTAGIAVQLPTVSCKKIFVQAHESNTGAIVVGSSTVVAASVGRRGIEIFPTQVYPFDISNLNQLWVDSLNNGDKITYVYEV